MDMGSRDAQLGAAFVEITDIFVNDFDLADLLQTVVDDAKLLLNIDEAGLLVTGEGGGLQVLAATSERSRLMEALQLSGRGGPGAQSFSTGKVVSVADIRGSGQAWQTFERVAEQEGFRAVHAVPMRLREKIIGGLTLFSDEPNVLAEDEAKIAQSLADIATIAIISHRVMSDHIALSDQLQSALNSRVIIEQAKGIISQTSDVTVDAAFELLRTHARSRGLRLTAVAREIVDLRLTL